MKLRLVLVRAKRYSSPPSRGAWIEIRMVSKALCLSWSPPSRGAWIEILCYEAVFSSFWVAPLVGGVD